MPRAKLFDAAMLVEGFPLGTKEYAVFKFVKVKNQFRFHLISHNCANHSDMLNKEEIAEAAGSIYIDGSSWSLVSTWSDTLNLGSNDLDVECLDQLLSRQRNLTIPAF